MTALSAARNTPRRGDAAVNTLLELKAKASQTFYTGALVMVNASGYALPGAVAASQRAAGVFDGDTATSGSTDGATTIRVRRGTFKFANYGSDAVTQAEVLSDCYIYDDQTVAKTSATNTRSVAGKVIQVESDGVWVEIGN